MKKSLAILSVAVALISYQSNAFSGSDHADQYCTSSFLTHSSSLKVVGYHQNNNPYTNTDCQYASVNQVSNGLSLMINANSPSARRSNHWLENNSEEEIAPMSPDQLDDLVKASEPNNTIAKVRRIERNKVAKVEVAEVTETEMWYETVREDAHLEIYISGGGYRGGINPKIHDQVMISNSGLVQKYYESEVTGVIEYKKLIDREELFQLVQWIAESGFFEFDREYRCADGDEACSSRMDRRPEPIPLKVVIALGPYRNIVTVPIYAPERGDDYIDYPKNLRKIVKAIYDFASL